MNIFQGFHDKDFLEQVTILNQLSCDRNLAHLPGLIALLENPTGDMSVDTMVSNAVNAIFLDHPQEAVKGLDGPGQALRTLCIRACGELLPKQALPELMKLAESSDSADQRHDVLTTLSRYAAASTLPIFQKCSTDEDDYTAALCIEACGRLGDESSIPRLREMLLESQNDEHYAECSIRTWKTINALASIGSDSALEALAESLHHKNPTARRIITDAIVTTGEGAVPFLLQVFEKDDTDLRILVANLLGFIGSRAGADGLVEALDQGLVTAPNVRYAVFEALGRIGTIKGIICLMDGLAEEDELTLMAVVGGLERQVNPGMVQQVSSRLAEGGETSRRLARVLIASKAVHLFSDLYAEERIGTLLMDALAESHDPDVVAAFDETLSALPYDRERIRADMERLPGLKASTRTALVADDSRSMLAMQQAILTELGYRPVTASDGAQALELAEQQAFDLVVTDMNMPVMDGMELIQELRSMQEYAKTPIIMVTTESEAGQRSLAEDSGVTAFITKPFRPQALKAVIADLTG